MGKAPLPHPCVSCPYRTDVPSGVWHVDEYAKLPEYDRPTIEQPMEVFFCHQRNGHICSGWVGCHDMDENFAIRLNSRFMTDEELDAVYDFESAVPLFESGQEAMDHGLREIDNPSDKARLLAKSLIKKGKGE